MTAKACLRSMRLRTLPLSLSGIALGVLLAARDHDLCFLTVVLLALTTVCLQILSNLSNELGDTLSGTDRADRQGIHYSIQDGEMTIPEMKRLIGCFAALSCLFGFGMVWSAFGTYYHLTPVVGLGAVAEYAKCKAMDDKAKVVGLNETFITVMPSVKFNWLRKKHFGMYSGLSAGVMFVSVSVDNAVKAADPEAKDETKAALMFQGTALGAEFGGEQFRGFVEAGFGEKGMLCAGLRYKF